MFGKKTPQEFRGEPRTRLSYDRKGNPRFDIDIKALTPLGAKIADRTTDLGTLAGLGWTLTETASLPEATALTWGVAVALPLIFRPALRWMFREQFKKTTRVRLTGENFSIRGRRDATFDRGLPHSFAVIDHDEKEHEQDKHDFLVRRASRRGRVINPPKYYGESYHLIFEHLGQRHDIAAIYGKKTALDAQARLAACDDRIDTLTRSGPGTPFAPDDEWADAPGTLPRK